MLEMHAQGVASTTGTEARHPDNIVVLRSKAGFSPDLESTRMWEASLENAKQPPFGICDIRGTWLQVPSFPRARPRMCRREVWVAALRLNLQLVTYRGSLTCSTQF